MIKVCKRCGHMKALEDFSAALSNKDHYANTCKPCVAEKNKAYWKTPFGCMSKTFVTQKHSSVVRGHPLPAYTLEELFAWAINKGLNQLIAVWKSSNYSKSLSPSVDRLDANIPYTLDNIRMVTWQDNNSKAYEDRKKCAHITKQNRLIHQLDLDGIFIKEFGSISAASRETGIARVPINYVCLGKKHCNTAGGFKWVYAGKKQNDNIYQRTNHAIQ